MDKDTQADDNHSATIGVVIIVLVLVIAAVLVFSGRGEDAPKQQEDLGPIVDTPTEIIL